jgi:peroxiredoxin (alkyl hydroperoxide reductase subunit C)
LISVDSQYAHLAYKNTHINQGGIGDVQITMVSDIRKEIATAYNVLCDGNVAFRATVIIDENFKIRHLGINDLPIGRNVNEVLRLLDAIDHANKHGEVCPEGWIKEEKAMDPSFKGVIEYLKDKFAK